MGLGSLFAIGAGIGACLLAWFFYGFQYSGFQSVRLLFLVSVFPAWLAGNRADRYSKEAQALFKRMGKRVPKEFRLVSEALSSGAAWARPGLLQDYQRWQRILVLLAGIAFAGVPGAFVIGIGVLQRS
ncbi:hypothetical protein [Roseateles sp. BYS87W]|uniref:Uncharacterized protein n=1 Tax=Pelomonas baiyunensis TaxID=3299026 RepID=A0ABW7H4E7_9BURK